MENRSGEEWDAVFKNFSGQIKNKVLSFKVLS